MAKIFNRGGMKEIKRDIYLEKLISRRENGLIKVITGIRSYRKKVIRTNRNISKVFLRKHISGI